jgi:hypothetical protein
MCKIDFIVEEVTKKMNKIFLKHKGSISLAPGMLARMENKKPES